MLALVLTLGALLGTEARIALSAAEVKIGEPFEVTFEVQHDSAAAVKLPDAAALPRQFAFIEDLGSRREIDASDPSTTTTRARWRVMALTGGSLEFPALDIGVDASGATQVLHARGPKITVEHGLKEGEDAPRPARGFRDAPLVRSRAAWVAWIALGLVVAAAVAVALRWARKKRQHAPVPPVTPADQLRALEGRVNDEPDRAREHVFALTAIVRGAIDQFTGENRGALNDDEWARLVSSDARVPAQSREIAARLLADAERVKYGGETPSILGVREVLARANEVLLALSSSSRTAA